jgi:hypothetical protein
MGEKRPNNMLRALHVIRNVAQPTNDLDLCVALFTSTGQEIIMPSERFTTMTLSGTEAVAARRHEVGDRAAVTSALRERKLANTTTSIRLGFDQLKYESDAMARQQDILGAPPRGDVVGQQRAMKQALTATHFSLGNDACNYDTEQKARESAALSFLPSRTQPHTWRRTRSLGQAVSNVCVWGCGAGSLRVLVRRCNSHARTVCVCCVCVICFAPQSAMTDTTGRINEFKGELDGNVANFIKRSSCYFGCVVRPPRRSHACCRAGSPSRVVVRAVSLDLSTGRVGSIAATNGRGAPRTRPFALAEIGVCRRARESARPSVWRCVGVGGRLVRGAPTLWRTVGHPPPRAAALRQLRRRRRHSCC